MSGFEHRGVVEGFYGPPWSHADRLWMLERMGAWGLNRYVYAPNPKNQCFFANLYAQCFSGISQPRMS